MLEKEREWEREKHWFVVPLIYSFVGWFLYVPWPGIEPTTVAHWDNALTNWASYLARAIYIIYIHFYNKALVKKPSDVKPKKQEVIAETEKEEKLK